MIIVDTPIWVDHFRNQDPALMALILQEEIALHPYVHGELLLGGFPAHGEAAEHLNTLLRPPVATEVETAAFISWAKLSGTGIGYVDSHLLVSAKLAGDGRVLTRDKKLYAQANRLGIAHAL